MKHPFTAAILLGLALTTASAQTSDFRTFTNAQGKAIQAKFVSLAGGQVAIEIAGGKTFTLGLNTFSAADQDVSQSLFADAPLFQFSVFKACYQSG